MSCQACHQAKVKCSHNFTPQQPTSKQNNNGNVKCTRCLRRQLPCVPHVSRQGQGKKRRRPNSKSQNDCLSSIAHKPLLTEGEFIKSKKLGNPEQESLFSPQLKSGSPSSSQIATQQPHYGLHHILRLWVGFAFRRRSFGLLEIVAKLGNKLHISMDCVFCGEGLPTHWVCQRQQEPALGDPSSELNSKKMTFLETIITTTAKDQEPDMDVTPLSIAEIPNEVLRLVDQQKTETPDESIIQSRWIVIRENGNGKTRLFVSESFQKDVVLFETIQSAWKSSFSEIKNLWLTEVRDRDSYNRSLIQQIFLHRNPAAVVPPDRSRGLGLRLKSKEIVEVDLVFGYFIENLDRGYSFTEYIPRVPADENRPGGTEISTPSLESKRSVTETSILDQLPGWDEIFGDDMEGWVKEILDSAL